MQAVREIEAHTLALLHSLHARARARTSTQTYRHTVAQTEAQTHTGKRSVCRRHRRRAHRQTQTVTVHIQTTVAAARGQSAGAHKRALAEATVVAGRVCADQHSSLVLEQALNRMNVSDETPQTSTLLGRLPYSLQGQAGYNPASSKMAPKR